MKRERMRKMRKSRSRVLTRARRRMKRWGRRMWKRLKMMMRMEMMKREKRSKMMTMNRVRRSKTKMSLRMSQMKCLLKGEEGSQRRKLLSKRRANMASVEQLRSRRRPSKLRREGEGSFKMRRWMRRMMIRVISLMAVRRMTSLRSGMSTATSATMVAICFVARPAPE